MNVSLQVFLVLGTLFFFALTIYLIRNRKIDLEYSLLWVVTAAFMFVVVLFPNIILSLAKYIGIIDPINMLFYFGLFFLLLIVFSLSVAVSRQSNKIKELAQELALLEYQLKKLQ